MQIRVLKPDVASKIAAGEVIERPASVVKELLDNSMDAGATQIAVEIQGGGVRLIRVVDNGAGIPGEEVETAFERFATSKVSKVEDLETISSLGFRGEALPSVAAIAEVTMVTRQKSDLSGTFISIQDGAVLQKGRRGSPEGTTVTVRNLFRHVPARLKFLKSPATEQGHISQLVAQYILAFPEVRFTLVTEGRTSLRSSGNGSLRDSLAVVYGAENARNMLEVQSANGPDDVILPLVSGFTSSPSVSRASRSYISFFVNRRWVQNRMLTFALQEAYQGLMITGRHPIAVINISLPPGDTDVNVHPSKHEVRFRNERDVFTAVQKAVRAALIAQSPIPSFETLRQPEKVEMSSIGPLLPAGHSEPVFLPAGEASSPAGTRGTLPVLRVVGQLANAYIIAEGPDGMYLVDQHAAHERVLFEKIRAQRAQRSVEVQGMLQPVTVELTVRQQEILDQDFEAFSEYGFNIEHFGERTYLVRAIPAMLRGRDVKESLMELLDFLGEGERGDRQDRIAVSLACHGAVKAGQALSHAEIQDLIRQLEQAAQPRTCPHGRPTMIHLSASQLEKGFGRR